MPTINCVACPGKIDIDPFSMPFRGDVACPRCKVVMNVDLDLHLGTSVRRKRPSLDELAPVWDRLSALERSSLEEASLAAGAEAYTASELVGLRTLEAILRRVYGTDEMLGALIKRLSKDPNLSDLAGVLDYFRGVRNRVAHPERVSTKLDAESTLMMLQRVLHDVLNRVGKATTAPKK